MSFRGDNHARYGEVPPVQYPAAGQPPAQSPSHNRQHPGRRPSFNSGDDELFLTSPADQIPTAPGSAAPWGSSNNALSGYQHQYQNANTAAPSHGSYNPQHFAPQQNNFQRSYTTTNLPHHPAPSQRYSTAGGFTPALQQTYTPQTYNPAAYANSQGSPAHRQQAFGSYNATDPAYRPNSSSQGYAAPSPSLSYSATFSHPQPTTPGGYHPAQSSPTIGATSPHQQNPGYDPSMYGNTYQQGYQSNGGNPSAAPYSAPYPPTSAMPAIPQYSTNDQTAYTRPARSGSQASPVASSSSPYQASSGLQRHPTNAPLPSRPAENDARPDPRWNSNGQSYTLDGFSNETFAAQESMMQDIEAELNANRQRPPATSISGQPSNDNHQNLQRYDSNATTLAHSSSGASANKQQQSSFDDADDDDPEGTAGVLAMRQAELDERRFSGNTFVYSDMPAMASSLPAPAEEQAESSDSELGENIDLGMLSGGYAGNLAYGTDVASPPTQASLQDGSPRPAPSGYFSGNHSDHPRTPSFNNAEVDYGGTGGLQPPTEARLSFDDGEENVSLHSRQSGTESPTKDEYQDFFYHPGLSNRPLPAVPPAPSSDSSSMISRQASNRVPYQHAHSMSTDSKGFHANAPEAFYTNNYTSQQQLQPERSISLSGHSNTPQVQPLPRSRTDAAEERRKLRQQQHLTVQGSEYDSTAASSVGAFDSITLPTGRKRKVIPSKLVARDFDRCTEPWALSNIEAWVRDLTDGEPDLKVKIVEDSLVYLFTFKVPTMNVADAEALGNRVVALMLKAGVLIPDEEWVKFGRRGQLSGVLWQMTGSGCYAPKLHDQEMPGRCYSHHCTRTLRRVDLDDLLPEDSRPTDEWHVFYNMKKEDWEAKPKKEVERQNIQHEIVTGEETYIKQLDIFRSLYRDDLRTRNPPIIHPDRRDKFLTTVFGKVDTVLQINKDHLLAQLKYRQQEQGPWIVGFSDIFREWIRKAKGIYIEYAAAYPRATYMVRKEAGRNILFRKFLEDKQRHKSSSKQDWTHFLITPLQRLQRYILLLESVDQKSVVETEEKLNLKKAIDEIKAVTMECDAKVEETNNRVQMMELDRMLVLRSAFQSKLNLDHLGRHLIIRGDLQRVGSKAFRWVDTHALLFDHYLILAKEISTKDGRSDKKYDVSREPIPMPLLYLDSMNDEPVLKQKGIGAPLGRTTTASASNTQLNKVSTNSSGRNGGDQTPSLGTATHLSPNPNADPEGKVLYPFRVKHLGHEVYTLYASSRQNRDDWCNKIIEAKTRHAKSLFSQNAEPFRLRVLADAAFHYDASSPYSRAVGVPVKGTPLDRAIHDVESVLGSAQGVAPVCRAQVNCAVGFTAFGKSVIAIGTDYGVFISDPSNPRGWTRTVQASRITQIAVLEDFSICLVIADRSLIAYPLDVVAPVSEYHAPPVSDNPRHAPHRLAKDVTYFATAKMKERTLVFYKRKEGLHTSFKVLEPIYHRAAEKRSRVFGGGRRSAPGNTESFRDYDEFFFPTECYSLNLFQTYIAVSTAKGIEMLTLDKKQPMSVPDLKAPSAVNIANRIRDQRPLGMFRLNDNEFILTYEDCAVYVDKHGDVSRTLIMEYTGKQKKSRGATMYGQYLLLFNEDYLQVRNAENGRLRQIIAGRDVRVIDAGIRGPTGGTASSDKTDQTNGGPVFGAHAEGDASMGTVKIAMCHPEIPGRQIVLEMLLNDDHTEK